MQGYKKNMGVNIFNMEEKRYQCTFRYVQIQFKLKNLCLSSKKHKN